MPKTNVAMPKHVLISEALEDIEFNKPFEALYIHIPFCAKRCNYCDFYTEAIDAFGSNTTKAVASGKSAMAVSGVGGVLGITAVNGAANKSDSKIDAYLDMLIREIRICSRRGWLGNIKSIYIGGGTPTHIGHKRLVNLVYTLSLSLNLEYCTEFSLEANPESINKPMLRDLHSLGVSRLSIGVQSFVDSELKTLGRIHDSAKAIWAIEAAGERFDNISIDLMCGIAGQTPASWQRSLDKVAQSDVSHVSIYPLTIEDNSAFGRDLRRGKIKDVDGDMQADMMEDGAACLKAMGFERYEVASFAKFGSRCIHNIAYWTGAPYLGLGSAAVSMCESKTARIRLKDGQIVDRLTTLEAKVEDLMLGMRMTKGVSKAQVDMVAKTYLPIQDVFEELVQLKLVTLKDERYTPTAQAWLLGNEIYSRIWNCLA